MKIEANRNLFSRILCMVLVLMIILACAGCGNAEDASSATGGTEPIGGGEYDVVGKSDKEPTLEELQKELNLPDVKITGDKVTYLNWMPQSYLTDPSRTFYHVNQLMQKYYGCTLEFITTTYEQLPTKAAQMVLSGQSPDIIFYKSADNPGFIYSNVVQPINDHVDINSKFFDKNREQMNELSYDGKVYFINGGSIANNGVVVYNKQMITDIGEKTPIELYREGKWTWSAFRELANKLTVDSNGDGTPEIYGCNYDELYIYTSCGEDFVKFADDGTVINNMKSANIAKAMNLLHNLGKAGDNVKGGSLADHTSAMKWMERWEVANYSEYFKNGTMDFAPSPKMDGSSTYYVPGRIEVDWLAAGAPNPGGAIAYVLCGRILNSSEYYSPIYNEISSDLTYYTDEQKTLLKELQDFDIFTPVPSRMEGVGNWDSSGMFSMLDEIAEWGTPWTTCLETYFPAFQAEVDRANELRVNSNK